MSTRSSTGISRVQTRFGDVAWIGPTGSVNATRQVELLFDAFAATLPDPADEPKVLVKPNCNNDLHWLTGNSTSLALIARVVDALRERGYRHVVIGDGPNVGIHRIGADVFRRLGLDQLARAKQTGLVNLNHQPARTVRLGRWQVEVAAAALDADLIVNLPKLKTHQETGLSLAVKNCMGTVVGLQKKTIHESLVENLVRLAGRLRPRLNILNGTSLWRATDRETEHPGTSVWSYA